MATGALASLHVIALRFAVGSCFLARGDTCVFFGLRRYVIAHSHSPSRAHVQMFRSSNPPRRRPRGTVWDLGMLIINKKQAAPRRCLPQAAVWALSQVANVITVRRTNKPKNKPSPIGTKLRAFVWLSATQIPVSAPADDLSAHTRFRIFQPVTSPPPGGAMGFFNVVKK